VSGDSGSLGGWEAGAGVEWVKKGGCQALEDGSKGGEGRELHAIIMARSPNMQRRKAGI
jgi:hypothetical protein